MHADKPAGRVVLTGRRAAEVEAGHLWVYAGHIQDVSGEPMPGDVVEVAAPSGRFCGLGLYNPHSKIRVRFVTFRKEPLDESFWTGRLRSALALRSRVVSDTTAYRIVHGESDLLPGLIVDRYGDLLSIQTLSWGMDRRKTFLADLLLGQTGARAVYQRNDAASRTLEGLSVETGFLRGDGTTTVEIREGPARFLVDVAQGQKTGWFCDQRENRLAAASLASGAEVLEACCHTGAFGIHCALRGATSVLGLDVSATAVASAQAHAALNGVESSCHFHEGDAFQELRKLARQGRRFDLVILDPPAFTKSRQAVASALAGYKEINRQALALVKAEGFLVTCSCSHHVSEDAFRRTVAAAAADARRRLRLVEARSQGRDHPVLAAMPETRYLKCLFVQVL